MNLDRMLGINTSLTDRSWDRRRCHPCQPTPMAALEAVARRLTRESRVADLGCGTGRAVFALAALAGCQVTGVELDERRYAVAMDNLRRCARRAPEVARRIRLICGAAQDQEWADEDVFYAFNPFPAGVLRGVLTRIEASLIQHPRRVRLFAYYPDDAWVRLLSESCWRLVETIDLRAELGRDFRERVEVFERPSLDLETIS